MKILKKLILFLLVLTITAAAVSPRPNTEDIVTEPQESSSDTSGSSILSPEDSSVLEPVEPSVLDFLKIAIQPIGSTMYVYGGGWNEEDTGAGIEAVTLGVSDQWAAFAAQQDENYDYKTTRYQIHDGLDCSGYVGWAVYNVLETESGKTGYVVPSSDMANILALRGLGEYIDKNDVTEWKAGDIMSMNGHVWISLGMCEDGSVLMVHASPPGVVFSGTKLANGEKSQAVELAEKLMRENYPDWYAKYPDCSKPYTYLTGSSAMRWSRDALIDEEGVTKMPAHEVAAIIFE